MEIGDRVYHRGISGNGYIAAIDPTKQYDKYGIVFSWLKYKPGVEFHNLDGLLSDDRGRWCSEDQLVVSQKPNLWHLGKVSLIGNRSLEQLIRQITEIRRTKDTYNSTKVVVNYGAGTRYIPRQALVLNHHIDYDKVRQCTTMIRAEIPVPDILHNSTPDVSPDGTWILKPHISMGGRDIEIYTGQSLNGRYFQRKVNKVREFRVHVALWYDNPAYLIQEKIIDDTNQLCWNMKQGGTFHYVHEPHMYNNDIEVSELFQNLKDISIKAVRALKLDFGGVDLALDYQGRVWVFEVNTRCGLRERTFSIFKQVLWALEKLDVEYYTATRWEDI